MPSTSTRRLAQRWSKAMRAEARETKHWRERIAFVSCVLCLACGCVQGPDYVKPTVEVPPAYRFGEQFPGTAQQPAWWNAYHDLQHSFVGELGDGPVGPHSPRDRGCPRQLASNGGSAARGDPHSDFIRDRWLRDAS